MFNLKNIIMFVILSCVLALGSSTVTAKVTSEEAAKLKSELNPLGAQKEGNADGTIPPWTGESVKVPAEWKGPGSHHPDPFPEDKPLYVITAENMDQYADKLSDGQKALLKTYPDTFKMPVYKTRRTASYPDWYVKNTYQNALNAELEADGNGVLNTHAGIPFPIPKTGLEVLWNHLLRYTGIYMERTKITSIVPDKMGRYVPNVTNYFNYFPYYDPNGTENDILNMGRVEQLAPPRQKGDKYIIIDYISAFKNPRNAYRYFAGQRRLRRAPLFAYDTPVPASRGLVTMDDFNMFEGSPDRFEWKLVGKKEMVIPYNNFRLQSPELKISDIIQAGHPNPDVMRYELHRVWIVEGKRRDGERHIYLRRVKYIDEDSWVIHISDRYDEEDKLWRCAMMYTLYAWDLPGIFSAGDVHHDLNSRNFSINPIQNETGLYPRWDRPVPPEAFFSPQTLRGSGIR